jgi:hypothetical protein
VLIACPLARLSNQCPERQRIIACENTIPPDAGARLEASPMVQFRMSLDTHASKKLRPLALRHARAVAVYAASGAVILVKRSRSRSKRAKS